MARIKTDHGSSIAGAALDWTFSPARGAELRNVSFHATANVASGEFKVQLDATSGEAYDVVLYKENVGTKQDVFHEFIRKGMQSGDSLNITCPATSGESYGVAVEWEPL